FQVGETRKFFLTMEAMSTGSSNPVRFGLRANNSVGSELGYYAVAASTVPVGQWVVHTALVEVPSATTELVPQIRAQSGANFHIAYVSVRQVTPTSSRDGYSLTYAMPAAGEGGGGSDPGDVVIPPIS